MSVLIRPMLATAGVLPPDDGGWAYEMKWDGVRAIVYIDDGMRLYSRNNRDVTVSYPELTGLAEALGAPAVLDGEIVALEGQGRPSFGLLQRRMHVGDAQVAHRLSIEVPAVFLAFDLLRLGDASLLDQPYRDRRELLDRLEVDGAAWQTPPALHGDGADALRASRDQRLEGVVAKRLSSRYLPGVRSREWIKIKNLHTQEVVIGGWRRGEGRRAGTVGALLMGVPDGGGVQFVGRVGTGFTDAVLADLAERLERLASTTSPFAQALPRVEAKDAKWVRPVLVGEVEFSERTADGRLRHPVWRGLRPDKEPGDVVWES